MILTPRIYSQNFKWAIKPKNKIDTLVATPVDNTPLADVQSYTQEVTSVTVGDETNVSLPVATSRNYTFINFDNNYESGAQSTMCINQVSGVVATGSVLFELSEPLPTMPTAKLCLEGTTYHVNRGSQTHDTLYNISFNNLATWIKENANGSDTWTNKSTDTENRGSYDDPTLIDYTASSVPKYGWVRKIIPAVSLATVTDRPEEQDVLTTWVDQSKSDHWALTNNWTASGKSGTILMWPTTIYATGNIKSTQIALRKQVIPITAKVLKIDDYTYRVDYSVPVRYEYMASSQYYTWSLDFSDFRKYHDLDNYCFLDLISKITVELSTQQLNTETYNVSYSLDDSGNLSTTEIKNEHPINFTYNELITSGATWGEQLWLEHMSEYLLKTYGDGAYIVECEVPASWALENDVHVNTEMQIKLQNGQLIKRKDTVCTFQVKTIEKTYRDSKFYYALRLMEVRDG